MRTWINCRYSGHSCSPVVDLARGALRSSGHWCAWWDRSRKVSVADAKRLPCLRQSSRQSGHEGMYRCRSAGESPDVSEVRCSLGHCPCAVEQDRRRQPANAAGMRVWTWLGGSGVGGLSGSGVIPVTVPISPPGNGRYGGWLGDRSSGHHPTSRPTSGAPSWCRRARAAQRGALASGSQLRIRGSMSCDPDATCSWDTHVVI